MNKYTFSFQNFQTISAFGRDNSTITTKADNDQSDILVVEIWSFRKLIKPKNSEKKHRKEDLTNLYNLSSVVLWGKQDSIFFLHKHYKHLKRK